MIHHNNPPDSPNPPRENPRKSMSYSRPLPKDPFATPNGPIVMGHRGARGYYPENTLLSFQKAVEMGVDALETDIHSTADGVLVVHHDDTVDRTTNGTGPLHRFTLAELKQLDAGYRWTQDSQTFPFRGQGITIPTLEELFLVFPDYWINIDIKQATPSIVLPFVQLIRQHNMLDKVFVGSFHDEVTAQFRRACPEVPTAASIAEVKRMFLLNAFFLGRFYQGQAQAFQIPEKFSLFRLVTRRFIRAAHQKRVAVHVWTVNETADMQRLIRMGVDCLMTDYPDRLLRLLGRL